MLIPLDISDNLCLNYTGRKGKVELDFGSFQQTKVDRNLINYFGFNPCQTSEVCRVYLHLSFPQVIGRASS